MSVQQKEKHVWKRRNIKEKERCSQEPKDKNIVHRIHIGKPQRDEKATDKIAETTERE
jgi:hypothetical protein